MRRPSPKAFGRFARYALAHPELFRAGTEEPRAAFVAYHVDRMSDAGVRAANRALVRWSLRPIPSERLRKITVPAALIWGRNDRIMRFRIAERTSARTGWPLYPIEDCGHVPMAERPEAFLEALRSAMGEA
jgi:pimeloyl-ACP methyl ester carboxylesterase